jgi:hypothetical protein
MEKQLLSLLGSTTKHILGGILHALRAVALAFIIVAVLAAGATEGIAAALTKQFPPSGPTHLAAAALGIAFGYAAAITVAVEEILRTIIKAFEVVIQEAEKLGKEAVQEAEKIGRGAISDAGSVGRAVTGVVGGVVGGVGHEAHSIEQGVASHLPGHRSEPVTTPVTSAVPTSATAATPTLPSSGNTR